MDSEGPGPGQSFVALLTWIAAICAICGESYDVQEGLDYINLDHLHACSRAAENFISNHECKLINKKMQFDFYMLPIDTVAVKLEHALADTPPGKQLVYVLTD
jgi:hypothetical protein